MAENAQVNIAVNPALTITASAEALKWQSRVVASLIEGASSAPVTVPLDGVSTLNEEEVIDFFKMLHAEDNLGSVDTNQWKISWVVLADLLQIEHLYERLAQWFWTLKQHQFAKDFWTWVQASRLRTVQRYRPDDAPSTATREDVFSVIESFPRARLMLAVIDGRAEFLSELSASHVLRLLSIRA